MGNGMNKVMKGLYLGNFRDSRDVNQLAENKITHILSIHDNARPLNPDKIYLCLQASDMPTQNISQYFSDCNDFIHKARLEGGTVLVHCLAGVSRSASIVIAYVMTVTNFTFRQSLDAVRGARRCVSPNFGFQRQLLEFQHERLPQEKIRLFTKFGETKLDEQVDCEVLLHIFKQSEQQLNKARSDYYLSNSNQLSSDLSNGASACEHYTTDLPDTDNGKPLVEMHDGLQPLNRLVPEKMPACSSGDCVSTADILLNSDGVDNVQTDRQQDIQDMSVSSSTESGSVKCASMSSPVEIEKSLEVGIQDCVILGDRETQDIIGKSTTEVVVVKVLTE